MHCTFHRMECPLISIIFYQWHSFIFFDYIVLHHSDSICINAHIHSQILKYIYMHTIINLFYFHLSIHAHLYNLHMLSATKIIATNILIAYPSLQYIDFVFVGEFILVELLNHKIYFLI